MTSDKELLEKAAKAAGIEIKINKVTPCYHGEPNFESLRRTHSLGRKADWIVWNPLTDDGDALRLAVKLSQMEGGLALCLNSRLNSYGFAQCYTNENTVSPTEDMSHDPYAATRRAIVRAAAEIGESMV